MSHATVLVALGPLVEPGDDAAVEAAIAEQMAPFDEGDSWFRDGSRWDWWTVGGRWPGRLNGKNVIRLGALNFDAMADDREARARKTWLSAKEDCPEHRTFIYGVDPDAIDLESYAIQQRKQGFSAHSFLRNHEWHEAGRMGWWGSTAATECEVRGVERKRCRWKDAKTEAILTCWNEEWDAWASRFQERFLAPLPPEEVLAMVDYHV